VAYRRKIKQKARRLWLEGVSFREIPPRLAKAFPNEKTPKDHRVIFKWSQNDDWNEDKAILEKKIQQKQDKELTKIADEITARSQRVVSIGDLLLAHIGSQAQQQPGQADTFRAQTSDGRTVEYEQLDPKDLNTLVNALNTLSSRVRIETLGYDKLTKLVLPDGTVLTPEDSQ
jgi:hypothetical protein